MRSPTSTSPKFSSRLLRRPPRGLAEGQRVEIQGQPGRNGRQRVHLHGDGAVHRMHHRVHSRQIKCATWRQRSQRQSAHAASAMDDPIWAIFFWLGAPSPEALTLRVPYTRKVAELGKKDGRSVPRPQLDPTSARRNPRQREEQGARTDGVRAGGAAARPWGSGECGPRGPGSSAEEPTCDSRAGQRTDRRTGSRVTPEPAIARAAAQVPRDCRRLYGGFRQGRIQPWGSCPRAGQVSDRQAKDGYGSEDRCDRQGREG